MYYKYIQNTQSHTANFMLYTRTVVVCSSSSSSSSSNGGDGGGSRGSSSSCSSSSNNAFIRSEGSDFMKRWNLAAGAVVRRG
jgi:hypothetical protein